MAGFRFQPQRQRPVCQTDVRGGEDPREIEMTRRETTSPKSAEAETASTGVNNDMYCPTQPRKRPPAAAKLLITCLTYIYIHYVIK